MILSWLPENVSTFGPSIDSVLRLIVYVVGTAFILAEGILLWFVISGRRRAGARAAYIRGETWRELRWVLIPVFIVACLDVTIDVRAKPVWEAVKEQQPAGGMTVKLAALQFGWKFTYPGPDGKFGAGQDLVQTTILTVPANEVIHLIISSEDVIHSFYVPQLRLRQDAVPGREIPAWFEVTRPGKYEIACSQLCGISHFAMKGILRVLPPDEYQHWLDEQRSKASAANKNASRGRAPAGGKEG